MSKKIDKGENNANKHPDASPKLMNKDDLEALDAFCAFELDEIDFETWCGVHESLDLQLVLTLSKEEAKQGGSKEITFTRSIRVAQRVGPPKPPQKCSVCQLVVFPSGIKAGDTLRIKGVGDQLKDTHGDLVVIIKVL